MRRRLLALAAGAVLAAACATAPPVVTAPVPPRHPEYMFPVAPPGTPRGTVERIARGWRYLQADQFAAAERELSAIVSGNRASPPGHAALGYLELSRGRAAQALTHFEAATSPVRPYVPALVGRGLALIDERRDEDALTSFEQALAIDASIPDLAERVATLRVRVVQNRINRAERAAAAGDWDQARTAYRAAIAASPETAFLYRDLALVERRAGRPETALELANAALFHDSGDVQAHLLIAEIQAERNEYDAALDAYAKAAAIEPSAAIDAAMARLRERRRDAALPEEFRAIPDRPQASRADVAALLGVQLSARLSAAPQRPVVVTDVRGHWAEDWILAVARAGAMEVYPNYTFQPAAPLRRADLADAISRALGVVASPAAVAAWDAADVSAEDVPTTHLAYPAVRRAVAAGVLRLDGDEFGLLRPVTGEEARDAVARLSALGASRP
ncbi:MAG: S-layer homology domain-containing protein [Vicinamibacterales bacterium]